MSVINTFEQYSKERYALSLDQMQELHKDLIGEIADDQKASEFYEKLVSAATEYASIRAVWLSLSREKKIEMDASRTAAHNAVIIHFNILSRMLRAQGKPAAWRESLGNEEEDKYCRKTIGDFACYIAFVNSLCAR